MREGDGGTLAQTGPSVIKEEVNLPEKESEIYNTKSELRIRSSALCLRNYVLSYISHSQKKQNKIIFNQKDLFISQIICKQT